MTAETLNFGPEWLRALSSGGSVTSPPPSPAMPKYKLAEYRYGREEMLALYIKDNKVPEDMQDKEFAAILQDEPMQPLALVPLTEEEQRNFSMSVNSAAVLRLMGKGAGGPAPAGVVRGRGAARGGRGRGRGEGGFYQRSIEDTEVGFGRNVREIHRSQSWDDRGERRFEKPLRREVGRPSFEESSGPVGPARKEYTRADSDNWRTLREEQEEDEGEPGTNWRLCGPRRDDGGPRSAGWRDHSGPGEGRRRKFDFDFRDSEGHGAGRRRAGSEGLEDDRDGLPEWCTDEEDGEMGTFDSSGAFMPLKKGGKETILEEDLDFKGIEDEDEDDGFLDAERNNGDGDKDKESKDSLPAAGEEKMKPAPPSSSSSSSSPPAHCAPPSLELQPGSAGQVMENSQMNNSHSVKAGSASADDLASVGGSKAQLSPSVAAGNASTSSSSLPPPPSSSAAPLLPPSGGDPEDDEGLKHLQQEAEKMVASLQDTSMEEECFTHSLQQQQESRNTAAALPLSHEAAMKWFYKDPQGEIQGPFTTVEMCEWFQAGYFTMTLLVKRGCDEGFQPLGDVIKMWGRVPFAPGPSPPPLLVRQLPPTQRSQTSRGSAGTGNLDQERLKKQQELATAALYQQLQQQQLFQLINRCSEQGMMPSMNRSMSVPDTGPLWDMHTSASQSSGGEASLWDLTMNPNTQGPTLEQLQKQLQERRDAELRAKREEEEQRKRREEKRRQQQEEQKRREEEELYRRKQQRQQQELLMKLLQQQQSSQQQGPAVGGSGWSSSPSSGLSKAGKSLTMLEMQEAERILKQQQQRAQQQRHPGLSMGSSSMGGQWADGVGMWGGPGGLEGKGGSGGSSSSMGMWDEAVKNQAGLRGNTNNNLGLKNSRSSPSLTDQYMMRRKRTEDEEKLLKLLQGMKPQDGFTTWCEQMLHALNTSANNSSSSLDVATIVAYLKEVESPYAVLDFIRSYLGDTVEAKEFAKQFLERRAKQKANQQRQQQQLSKEVGGLNMNFPLQDSMRGMNPSTLQSMFQANHMGKAGLYDNQGGKMKKKPPMMLHSDPSILGYSFHNTGECLSMNELEMVEDY
ncbi:PERQ amino acid-rich with GYF domain-containing protein 1 isoform X1 [Poecilia latipinna]|uniref:PERQ amino acid-rich with GYF domain-containing protein 1 isoform X1 n=1 Tax=Poecilia latipinna TaxID=48699 RepID=UPI00072EAFE9|nr:PREDICTED: PERQ amino acid-rich with GYF domain-containing protein 1 isoform X1 [Poecilia latipinna]XP_016533216.1 PREDICTED: PERQ amino acid-rich with GYF domain-containing protein 1 isoform X1 [Poecilia formosa]